MSKKQNKEAKQILSLRVEKSVIDWLKKEADKGRTTVSRLAAWYLKRQSRRAA